ncbi:MAG: radical SAM protein [Bacteroidetes bacterium]|nr:radical SAM protein [Bacteroidota bacterium]
MNIEMIECAITYQCNAHCKHCIVEDEYRYSSPSVIDSAIAREFVRHVALDYQPLELKIFGGEPLLYYKVVSELAEVAMECGVPYRSILTNGGIPTPKSHFRQMANSGLNTVNISVDFFHQEYIPLTVIEQNVLAVLDSGIENVRFFPTWVISEDADNSYNAETRSILQSLAHLPVEVYMANMLEPAGNAKRFLKDCFPSPIPQPRGSCSELQCGDILDKLKRIGIEPNGDIRVCQDFIIGNAKREKTSQIIDNYNPYLIPEAKVILEGGMAALRELYIERGFKLDTIDTKSYYSICDQCVSLRKMKHFDKPFQ